MTASGYSWAYNNTKQAQHNHLGSSVFIRVVIGEMVLIAIEVLMIDIDIPEDLSSCYEYAPYILLNSALECLK